MENSIEKIVERINELYHKKQTVGLSAEETEERTKLFEEYRVLFRQSLRSQLNNIDIENHLLLLSILLFLFLLNLFLLFLLLLFLFG